MTSKQFRALSPDQQRITVAELAGFTDVEEVALLDWLVKHDCACQMPEYVGRRNGMLDDVPDYLHDLNAVHDIERRCLTTINLQARYIRELKELAWDEAWTKADGWACFATAANGLVLLSWR